MKQHLIIMIICMAAFAGKAAAQNTSTSDTLLKDTKIQVAVLTDAQYRNQGIRAVHDAPNGEAREKVYMDWLSKFPEEAFDGNKIVYDHVRMVVAVGFMLINDRKKAMQYLALMRTQVRKL
jgi:hypothetical protein